MECECELCGKRFEKGSEGDNETMCLRCEREALLENMSEEDYEALDRKETLQ